MSRRFTHSEAESLLPQVEKLIREALFSKSQYDEAENSMQRLAQKVMLMGGIVLDRRRVLENKARRQRSAEQLKKAIEEIQEVGCLIKDLDVGLIDFPTTFRGEEVYLCWKLGESGIRFWHGVHEGFAGRKQIDQYFLDQHQGDPPN